MGHVEIGALKSSMVVAFGPSELIVELDLMRHANQSLLGSTLGDKLSSNLKNVVVNGLKCGFVASSSKD